MILFIKLVSSNRCWSGLGGKPLVGCVSHDFWKLLIF